MSTGRRASGGRRPSRTDRIVSASLAAAACVGIAGTIGWRAADGGAVAAADASTGVTSTSASTATTATTTTAPTTEAATTVATTAGTTTSHSSTSAS